MRKEQRLLILPLILVMVLTGLFACRHSGETDLGETAGSTRDQYNPYRVKVDPLFKISSVSLSTPVAIDELLVSDIPRSSIYHEESEGGKSRTTDQLPYPKMGPILKKWLTEMDDEDVVDIIITFREDLRIPLLPELGSDEKRESSDTARAIAIAEIKRKRNASQKILLTELENYGRFEKLESFWIVNSFVARLQIGEIEKLSKADFVTYLQPKRGGESPPADMITSNDVEDGRAQIVSDPYFNLGLTHPWIGILDTGVRETHDLLVDHIAWVRDCVNGGEFCKDSTLPGYDTGDASNHGTSTAAIIMGNSSTLGGEYRGVSEIYTDSWRIYTIDSLDSAATIRAIEAGIYAYDQVLAGVLQANEFETGAIAIAADDAYDAGLVIVAANGNNGPFSGTVNSPAVAHKVIGVGAFDIVSGAQYADQSRGPTFDQRIKPDIQAPTNSETARNVNDSELGTYGGTSGATPYAAAAAMLSRNWLRRFGYFDNGQTYAFMILYGQNTEPYDNMEGAGPLKMATDGRAWWGKVEASDQLNIDIPVNVPAGKQNFEVALWWPENVTQIHNNVDVFLIDPNGTQRAQAVSVGSVFERTGVNGALTPGNWIIRIRGESVPTKLQTVYWAAAIHNQEVPTAL